MRVQAHIRSYRALIRLVLFVRTPVLLPSKPYQVYIGKKTLVRGKMVIATQFHFNGISDVTGNFNMATKWYPAINIALKYLLQNILGKAYLLKERSKRWKFIDVE